MKELNKYRDLYSPEEIDALFMDKGYASMSPEKQDRRLFLYLAARHRNINLDFVLKGVRRFYEGVEEKEFNYQLYSKVLHAIHNHDLTDEFFIEYADYLDWRTISSRKDLTVEIFNKYKDKIEASRITVNLGEDFINENFKELDKAVLTLKGLSEDIALRYIAETSDRSRNLFKLMRDNSFDKTFFFKGLNATKVKNIKDGWCDFLGDVSDYVRVEDFSFCEMNALLDVLEPIIPSSEYSNDRESSFNSLIGVMLEKKITLKQKKDIKYRAILL